MAHSPQSYDDYVPQHDSHSTNETLEARPPSFTHSVPSSGPAVVEERQLGRENPIAATAGVENPPGTNRDLSKSEQRDVHKPTPLRTGGQGSTISAPARHGSTRTVLGSWSLEILSCLGSLVLLVAICIVLSQYNHKPSPSWPHNITLNTVISILATTFKALMLAATAEAISQTKWLWYRKAHPVSHIQRFEDASRGIPGSFRLLYIVRFKHFVVLGALITIIAIGTDPFFQQTVQYRACNVVNPRLNSSVPIAIMYKPAQALTNLDGASGPAPLDLAMQGAIMDGILNPGSKNTDINPVCQTGNCTFPLPYLSLGVCSSCTNTVYDLKSNCSIKPPEGSDAGGDLVCESSMPDGRQLNQTDYVYEVNRVVIRTDWIFEYSTWYNISRFNLLSYTRGPCTTDWQHGGERKPLTDCADVRTSSAQAANDTSFEWYNVVAASCELHYCLKTYNTTIEFGTLNETTVQTSDLRGTARDGELGRSDSGGLGLLVADPCWVNGTKRDFNDIVDGSWDDPNYMNVSFMLPTGLPGANRTVLRDCVRFVSEYGAAPLVDYFQSNLGIDGATGVTTGDFNDGNDNIGDVEFGSSFVAALYRNDTTSVGGLSDSLESLAVAMTSHMRLNDPDRTTVGGLVYDTTACVQVEWAWLAFPSAVLGISCLFLVWTILASSRDETAWKSSIYPVFFNALRTDEQDDLKVDKDLTEMKQDADTLHVRLPRRTIHRPIADGEEGEG
ncbi:hypothetical protein H2200_001835 [Cladophialophora chaetospira]|uniref:Uncharacterized protein n=1 Tax=Cladophialophora chaetospira TaxID=386627 RepID=A0AA39CNE3_9EURO|nr:hypothetical protein H2200_001835 [Cladophialophora chaetospira]